MVQLSHPYTTTGKTIALTIQTFVSKVMSLVFTMLSAAAAAKSLQSCPTLCDPTDGSLGVHLNLNSKRRFRKPFHIHYLHSVWQIRHGYYHYITSEETDSTSASKFFRIRECVREGDGTLLQYSCLENPMGRGAWKAAVHRITQSQTQLHFHFSLSCIG